MTLLTNAAEFYGYPYLEEFFCAHNNNNNREEEEYSNLPACRISETVRSLVLKHGLHIVVGSC